MGNVLRGDDGFGPAVVEALEAGALPPGVRVVDVGIGGVTLVHELMDGYDMLVVVDAVDRGEAPGTLYTLVPELPELDTLSVTARQELGSNTHQTVPESAFVMARAVGALPPIVRLIGCQPAETEMYTLEMTPPVRQAVPRAVQQVHALCALSDA